MTERVELRICIKFCQKMSNIQIKEWFRWFKDGRVSVDSDPRSDRLSTSKTVENVERVRFAIDKNRRLTVRELEEDLGIPKIMLNIFSNIEDLGMRKI
ncbi:hypothetical protein ALC60_03351 [Trachymyrmex zeteki]|uniref:Mos1 transposase HTH domain-containing protein n=1 Tax=Mycetomoellerius zeteki TaxID=64791 RepID=A0A151XBF3_9HYME|nr:hypothetical protein ALC60_03351 [Trachymyrmex zeteki]